MPGRRVLMVGTLVTTALWALTGCAGGKRMVGLMAPDFSLQDLSGKNVALSDFKGKPVLLSFWGAG